MKKILLLLFALLPFSVSASGLIDNDSSNDIIYSGQDGLFIEPKSGINAGKRYIVEMDVGNGVFRLKELGNTTTLGASSYHSFIDSFTRFYDYIDLHNGNIIIITVDSNNSDIGVSFQGLNLNTESFYTTDRVISTNNSLGNELEIMLVSNGTQEFFSVFPKNSTPNSGFCFDISAPNGDICNQQSLLTNFSTSNTVKASFPRSFSPYTDLERRNNFHIYQGLFFSNNSVNELTFQKYDVSNNVSVNQIYQVSPSVVYSTVRVYFNEFNISTKDYFFSISSNTSGIENYNFNFESETLTMYSSDSDSFYFYKDGFDLHKIDKNSYIFGSVVLQQKDPLITLIDDNGLLKYAFYTSGNWYIPNVDSFYSYSDISDIEDVNDVVNNIGFGGGGGSTGTGSTTAFLDVVWDSDGDGEIGFTEFVSGIGNTISAFFGGIGDFFVNVGDFLKVWTQIGNTDEVKTIGFIEWLIPTSHATEYDGTNGIVEALFDGNSQMNLDNVKGQDNIIGVVFNALYYGIIFFGAIFILLAYFEMRKPHE